jgi:hypothetical protein
VERKVEALSCVSAVVDRVLQSDGDATTRDGNRPFEQALNHANVVQPRHASTGTVLIRCMLTGLWLPSECVIASHIFKHKWGKLDAHKEILDFYDIDSVGNGLLLFAGQMV